MLDSRLRGNGGIACLRPADSACPETPE